MGQPSDVFISLPVKHHNLALWLRFSLSSELLLPRNPSPLGLVMPYLPTVLQCDIQWAEEAEAGAEKGGKTWVGHRVESDDKTFRPVSPE